MTRGDVALNRATALLTLGRAREAESVVRTALLHSPDNGALLSLLGSALYEQQRYDEARDAARLSLAFDPDNARGLMRLSAAEAGCGDIPNAIKTSRRAVQLDPENAAAHRQLGALLLNSNRPRDSLAQLRMARTLDPSDGAAATTLALAHLQLRQYTQARTQVADALRLDPNDPEAHRVAGLIESVDGRLDRALASSGEAMRLDPLDTLVQHAHAEVLKSRNPLYRWLIRRSEARRTRDWRLNLLLLYAPVVVLGVVEILLPGTSVLLFAAMLAILFAVWSLDPIMNLVVCLDGHRRLLETAVQRSALAYAGYLPVIAGCLVWGAASGRSQPLWAAVIAGGWALVVSRAHHAIREVRKGVWAAHACGAGLVLFVCWLAVVVSESFGQNAFLVAAGAYVCWFVEVLDWRAISAGYGP